MKHALFIAPLVQKYIEQSNIKDSMKGLLYINRKHSSVTGNKDIYQLL